jgi:hypothetical protein
MYLSDREERVYNSGILLGKRRAYRKILADLVLDQKKCGEEQPSNIMAWNQSESIIRRLEAELAEL